MANCEGLGPLDARTFLNGRVPSWQVAPDLTFGASTLFSTKAAEKTRALARVHGAVDACPDGTVSTPGVTLACGTGGERKFVTFDAEERDIPGPVSGLRVANAWVFDVDHWARLLWANLLALGPFLWADLVGSPVRLAWAAARAGSTRPEDVAARLNRIGKGARVHRDATVEGAWIGCGAVVGAGAVVRGTILGAGATVEELAMVEGCVLGAGARVQRQAMAKYSLIEEDAAFAGTVQLGVIGRGASVKHGAVLFDMTLGQSARVWRQGELVAAPYGMVGVCVGPGAVIGQGVRIAPGRVIPEGVTVLPDAGQVLRDVALPAGCVRARVANGRLEPME